MGAVARGDVFQEGLEVKGRNRETLGRARMEKRQLVSVLVT